MSKPKKNKRLFDYAELPFFAVYLIGISFALMYVLCRSYLAVTGVIMSAFTIGVAALFYVLRKHKGWSALAAAVLCIACMAALSVMPLWGEDNFMDFVFTSSTFFNPVFAAVAILCFGSVVGFVVCYFAVYSPRPCFMLLPAFIPLILSARTAGGVPEWILILMLAGYVMSAAGIGRPAVSEGTVICDKKAMKQRRAAIAVMGAAAALLLAVIPRSSKTLYGEKLDEVFAGRQGGYYMGSPTLTNFLSSSSVNRGANEPEGNLLFIVSGSNPGFLSRWSFDLYNGEDGWQTYEGYDSGHLGWGAQYRDSNPAALIYKLKGAVHEGKLADYADEIMSLDYSEAGMIPVKSELSSAERYVQVQNMADAATAVILHPQTVFEVNTLTNLRTYRTPRGEVFTEQNMPENAVYSMRYYADEPNESFIRLCERVDLRTLLAAARDEQVITEDEYSAFALTLAEASHYASVTEENGIGIPEKIVELAEEITHGLTGDYEKAKAIERWFGENGFYYDMEFVPARTDAEYFLFKSRRGICSDYASAVTLLARAAGLTARYDEGYYIPESTRGEDGAYYITDAQAHALTSVFIDGYGWMQIDATRYVPTAADSAAPKTALLIAVIAAGLAAVVVIIFRERITDAVFAAFYKLRSPAHRVRSIFKRTRALACAVSGKNRDGTSVGEVCAVVKNSLGMPQEAQRLRDACDELFYGSGSVSADTMQLYADYRAVKRRKRGMKK